MSAPARRASAFTRFRPRVLSPETLTGVLSRVSVEAAFKLTPARRATLRASAFGSLTLARADVVDAIGYWCTRRISRAGVKPAIGDAPGPPGPHPPTPAHFL